MPLYLASSGLGDDAAHLRAPTVGSRALVVLNALDPYAGRDRDLPLEAAALAALGWAPVELDLRDYSSRPAELAVALEGAGMMWVVGGNSFVLARAMGLAGLRPALVDRLRDPAFVYAGYSAGAVVAGPDLDGIELVDDPTEAADRVPVTAPAAGLGLVPFRVVPHWRSDHAESAAIEHVADHMRTHRLEHRCLHDGQALWVAGDAISLLG